MESVFEYNFLQEINMFLKMGSLKGLNFIRL